MRRILLLSAAALGLGACSLMEILDEGSKGVVQTGLADSEMVEGLKLALENGIVHGSVTARGDASLLDGYWKDVALRLLLPQDVQTAFDKADTLDKQLGGLGSLAASALWSSDLTDFRSVKDSLWQSINRAASHSSAQDSTVKIFKSAIVQMSFDDARGLLFTQDSLAATKYLSAKVDAPLLALFAPIIRNSLETVNANQFWKSASTSWNSMSKNYNSWAGNSVVQTGLQVSGKRLTYSSLDTLSVDLDAYVARKALDGLYVVMGREERAIRRDPVDYATDIGKSVLEKVFEAVRNEAQ